MERIVIRSSNWLGDAMMSVPAVRALKHGNPAAHIAVVTPEKLADVWRLVAEVDEVIAFPAAKIFGVAKLIRAGKFDTGVIFPNSLRTALEMWLARVPRRTGYAGHSRRWLLTDVFAPEKRTPSSGPGEHQVHHYLRLAAHLGAFFALDAARNADMIDSWHVDQVSARQGNVRSDSGPLGAKRLLGNLHQQFLSLLQQFLDRVQRLEFRIAFAGKRTV